TIYLSPDISGSKPDNIGDLATSPISHILAEPLFSLSVAVEPARASSPPPRPALAGTYRGDADAALLQAAPK
ncbi:hypothetical protein GWI33_022228, partial [Rhynchophorus ferrugineus]